MEESETESNNFLSEEFKNFANDEKIPLLLGLLKRINKKSGRTSATRKKNDSHTSYVYE